MKAAKLLFVVLSGFILFSFTAKHSLRYTGRASDLKSGELYYTEEHEEIQDGNSITETRIRFKDADNRVIVNKRIDYSRSKTAPDFIQEDLRDGYMEAAETKDGWTTLTHRKNAHKETETRRIQIPEPAVVDGGFTHFVKANWDKLMKGERITFHFAVPSQLDYYTFRVFKVENKNKKDADLITFKMEPDQLILRKLLPPILLQCNTQTKRLMQFEGISTINDEKGKSYRVRISYPKTGP